VDGNEGKTVLPLKSALRNYCSATTSGRSPRPDQVQTRTDEHRRNEQPEFFREQQQEAIFSRQESQHGDGAFSRENGTKQTPERAHLNINKNLYSPYYLKEGTTWSPLAPFGFKASEGEDSLGSQQIKQEENSQSVNLLISCDKF